MPRRMPAKVIAMLLEQGVSAAEIPPPPRSTGSTCTPSFSATASP